jgi:hypothetical protein
VLARFPSIGWHIRTEVVSVRDGRIDGQNVVLMTTISGYNITTQVIDDMVTRSSVFGTRSNAVSIQRFGDGNGNGPD